MQHPSPPAFRHRRAERRFRGSSTCRSRERSAIPSRRRLAARCGRSRRDRPAPP
jgi:hypothetical protein